ncbi:MAG: 2-C-methyl-D-erythritol 4-phosphate cytidylyltransferase [Firmicutes bacterium]|nr:2-C-methyl-D-erythritol 4-phosphate cytidylyltransferase [Bacillota bacterium]
MADRITLIVPAAGFGRRMGAAVAKQYLSLAGEPMLVHTLRSAAREAVVENIILVVPAEEVEWCREEIVNRYRLQKVNQVVAGGKERQDSVFNGLRHLPPNCEWVAVHDGARPLLPAGLLGQMAAELDKYQAVIAAVPTIDTIKQVDDELRVEATLERSRLWAVQTPQAFSVEVLKRAHQEAREAGCYATDDAALVERLGIPVGIVMGSYENFKVTTLEDLDRAEAILARGRTGEAGGGMGDTGTANRVGIGYDVHRLVEGRRLILGGVEIPYSHGLLGHSDADVLTHAVMDALLGALALGDLGEHFPDTDPRYAGISSLELLEAVCRLVEQRGYRVGNLDCVIVAERPKLAPFRDQMRENLARVLKTEPQRISVKATTTEGLGFTGRREGIAANAIVTLAG